MMSDVDDMGFGRRPFIAGVSGLLGATLTQARPASAQSAARRSTLVIALDFSDTSTLDPGRVAGYTNPLPTRMAYDPLVTMAPGDYVTVRPCIATEWAYLPDGKTLRFKLREDVRFVSGRPLTAEDVRFSFARLLTMKYQASQYLAHLDHVAVVDDHTVDFVLSDPTQPLLTIIAAPEFGISDKAAVIEHGGTDVDAADKDTATPWLDQNSVGSGVYRLTGWQRNQQISLVRNATSWAGKPGYERVLIRQMSESAAQLLALKRGDVDVAFNLIPEQIETLKDSPDIDIVRVTSLDFLYMAVSEDPDNPVMQKAAARQAIGYAIDYDGIINSLIGGNAVRPAAFLPVGTNGSTAELTKEIGYHEDLDRARKLLAEAGVPDGFTFKLNFANQVLAGVAYRDVAVKVQSDLARVGIKMQLEPMDMVSMYAAYNAARLPAVLGFWNPPAVENQLWASATVVRVAKRLHWDVPPAFTQLVHDAAAERDGAKAAALWRDYQVKMVEFAHLFVLIQPVYQVAVRKNVAGLKITAAGWMAEVDEARPA
jgi:peptide/nickel transport system substrate-binding protein